MANPIYTSRQADFIRHFVGSDSELTTAFNGAFGTDVSKAAMRKKRQRMGKLATNGWCRLLAAGNGLPAREARTLVRLSFAISPPMLPNITT